LWEIGSGAVCGAGQPGAARKGATSSRLRKLGRTGGKGGQMGWPLEKEPVSLDAASWYLVAKRWYRRRLKGAWGLV